MSRRSTALVIVGVSILVTTSCSGAVEDDRVRIAFIQDLSAPDADEHVQPALQAAELAVAMHDPGGVELVVLDLAEDPGAIDQVAADPSMAAAIVGPGADGSMLAEAGVPTVSVSTAGATPSEGAWRRFVAPMPLLADVIADRVRGREPCVVSDDPPPDDLAALLAERLGVAVTTTEPDAPGTALRPACGIVTWAGSPDPAVELVRSAPGHGMVGGDRLLDPDFRDDVGAAGEGTIAVCACVDVTTPLDPAISRFIQDYQSEFGTAPGPYAVEAWDATRWILDLLGPGTSRPEVASALAGLEMTTGLAGPYAFDAGGERRDAPTQVFELESGRWDAVPPT
jgi:branched-chain amino acid transport system substrate-binding protein